MNNPGEDGTSNQDTQSETSLVLDGSNVLAGFNDSTLYSGSSAHFTGYSVSSDGGQSFQDLRGLPNVSGGDAGDPVLARDAVTGRVYFATLNLSSSNNIDVFRSDNDLQSFLPTTLVSRSGGSLDKEWMTVDNFDGAGQGNVYLIVRDFGSGNGIFLFRSTDQGNTFTPSGGVQIVSGSSGNVQGAWVTVGPDHSVDAFWFDNQTSTEKIMMRKSTDGGQTFSPAVTVTTLRTTGINGDLGLGGGFRSNAFPQALANPVTGQLYVVYDDKAAGNDKSDVYFQYSNDGGSTWSSPVDIIDDTTGRDQWQPALAVTPNGDTIGVFWYDRRMDPADNLIDRFGALGTVAGGKVTFGPNFRITDTSFPVAHGLDPVVNSVYMGDYDQAVADNSGFYLTWGDNRSPSLGHAGNNADVRFTHIPVSVAGPAVIAVTPRGAVFPPLSTVRVVFDEPMDPTTFTADQFQLTDIYGNPINIDSITPVDDSDQRFDVTFDTQTATDLLSYKIGPYITDQNGNYMDQDGDGNPTGQDPSDAYFGTIGLLGPKVTASTPSGNANTPGSVNHVRLTFNESMDPTTFTSDQVYFTDQYGDQLPINSITPVTGMNNTQFDVAFDALTATGAYSMVIGPNILDQYGNAMDQNGNFIPGEIPGDQYVVNFGVLGPKVTASTPTGNANMPGTVNHVRLTFNESMDPTTFTSDQVYFTDQYGDQLAINSIAPVSGTNNTQFDISFDTLAATGAYSMVIGPNVLDLNGNAMDQNGNLIPGEIPGDQYVVNFGVLGPKVTVSTPTGNANLPGSVNHVRLTFNESMDPTTFTSDQVYFTDQYGDQLPINSITPVTGMNNTVFDVAFDPLYAAGTYHMVIGPNILDLNGNAMDQNGNLIPGEIPGDQYTATFGVTGPQVTVFARNGVQNQPVSSVRVTFNEPIDPTTFTIDQIVGFTDPQGNPLAVTDVQPVAGTNNTKFDISFDTQTLYGTYTLQIAGGGILDLYGNALPAAYTGMFIVTPVYTAAAYPFEDLDIHGLPGTFRVIQYADDDSRAVNLGGHTFNFYGVVYTGNNQLFASSNGLLTFGAANSDYVNTNLTSTPPQPGIAVLWSDWVKQSGTDMLEGYIDEANDRLILQWNAIMHIGGGNEMGITFQVILYLDTGGTPGAIVFNYVFLNTGDRYRDGLASTVGVKNAGNQGMDRLLVSFNQDNMLIGDGEAILIAVADQGGSPGFHGGRRRPVQDTDLSGNTPDVALAVIRPDGLTPPLAFAAAPALPSQGRAVIPFALLESGAARSVDQAFTRFSAGDLAAGMPHRHAAASDGIDPLILDLLEQAGAPL